MAHCIHPGWNCKHLPKLYCNMKDLGELPQDRDKNRLNPGFASDKVRFFRVDADDAGQRIDNFLLKLAKGVPKSHVYRVIRGGEVRVNKKRVDVTYRLEIGDELRVPPMRLAESRSAPVRAAEFPILFEDDYLLIINKPAGVAVHGGSGVSFGVVEQLRAARPDARYLELVHRLDRETSGVLMLAKKRAGLVGLHEQIRAGQLDKRYLVMVQGDWLNARQHVRLPLVKFLDGEERRVRAVTNPGHPNDADAVAAHTIFSLREKFKSGQTDFALLEAELKTGRTHQIRVHLASLGFPIAGDDKYGDFALNKELARPSKAQLKRMFLHAWHLGLQHPVSGEAMQIEAPLPEECERFLGALR